MCFRCFDCFRCFRCFLCVRRFPECHVCSCVVRLHTNVWFKGANVAVRVKQVGFGGGLTTYIYIYIYIYICICIYVYIYIDMPLNGAVGNEAEPNPPMYNVDSWSPIEDSGQVHRRLPREILETLGRVEGVLVSLLSL